MKKLLLLLLILFQFTLSLAQQPQWGSWTPVSCYSRLSTSVLGNGYVPSINEYSWQVRIKSSYAKKVTFNMTWIVGGERLSIGQVTLRPNESYGHTPRYFKSSSSNIVVEVSEVCFEGQDCHKNGYSDCNGNQVKNLANTSSSNNSSTNQTSNRTAATQKNDLSEYDPSKKELERQMQITNEEGQTKSQNYTNAMNAGILAHNSGNYAEAKRQFAVALNNCNTGESRIKAQEYYDKTINAEKTQTKIKAVGDLSQIIISGIQQQKEWAAEQKRKKVDRLKQIENENLKALEAAVNTLEDSRVFETYCDFVVYSMETLGFKFINMSDYSLSKTRKKIKISFINDVTVEIDHIYSFSKPAMMFNDLTFRTGNSINGNIIKNSDLLDFLKQLDYYDYEGHKNYYIIEKTGEYVYSFKLFGLEKTKIFTDIYVNGFSNSNYYGSNKQIKKIEESTKDKLSDTKVGTKELIQNGDTYRNGNGVEKNIDRALEFYQKALAKGDNEAIISIASTYAHELKNYEKAKELLEKYLSLDNIKNISGAKSSLSDAYNQLGDFDKAISISKEVYLIDETKYNKAQNNEEKYVAKEQIGFSARNIAQLYINKGDASEAITWYEIAASKNYHSAIFLAQIYTYGKATQISRALKLGSQLNFKKSKKLSTEWANKACQSANNDVLIYGDSPEKKNELEKSAKWCCEFIQNNILKN